MQILVVGNDESLLAAIHHTLTQEGYEVVVAHGGREGLRILRSGSCRLVISDWVSPEMDSLELCREIRNARFPGYVYIILLTFLDGDNDPLEGLSTGADDFITKPFNPAELIVRVRAAERFLSHDELKHRKAHSEPFTCVDSFDVARLSAWFGVPG